MHIAILMTNTDESDFAAVRPNDGEKFARLLNRVRPQWETTVFSVKDGVFPADDACYDGWVITGSPSSVHDPAPWIPRLEALVRRLVAEAQPLFGACFGHQVIAKALGGTVGPNPGGWVFGLTETDSGTAPWIDTPGPVRTYAAHLEQVKSLPAGALALGGNAACLVGSFALGNRVYTSQYHPEMTPDFIADLTDHLDGKLPADVIAEARASLVRQAETDRIARWIVAFFEQAQPVRTARPANPSP